MRLWRKSDIAAHHGFFEILESTAKTQFATMTLNPGQASGSFGNDHKHADQWLVVLEGQGEVKSEGGVEALGPGDVIVIPAPERHLFRCVGSEPMKTITFYGPPAYPDEAN